VKPPPFGYHRPGTVEEAARLLAELGDGAKVLAGGQSLVPLLNFRLATPEHLVDINRVAGLDGVRVTGGPGAGGPGEGRGSVEVGATVRHATLLRDPTIATAHPLLVETAGWIAHGVIRNRGTVCGSLAHADPAAELPALLTALGGSVEAVAWRSGALARRRVGATDLYTGTLTTSLEPDELLVAASFPTLDARTGWAVEELALRHGDYALAGVIVMVTVDGDGQATAARAAYLSCAPVPTALDLGPAIAGGGAAAGALHDLVAGSLHPTDDIHATGEYRRHLAATLTVRALDRALARARSAGPATDPTASEVPA
jgi:aerobic carbon-monoxide dehydrogenase medium subunit